jgi:hypothetical protein
MRKLKLQVQTSADGFVAGPEGQLDWMVPVLTDEQLLRFINHLTDTSDTILLGRKMTLDFVKYWEQVKPHSSEYDFARKMVDTPKGRLQQDAEAGRGKEHPGRERRPERGRQRAQASGGERPRRVRRCHVRVVADSGGIDR